MSLCVKRQGFLMVFFYWTNSRFRQEFECKSDCQVLLKYSLCYQSNMQSLVDKVTFNCLERKELLEEYVSAVVL